MKHPRNSGAASGLSGLARRLWREHRPVVAVMLISFVLVVLIILLFTQFSTLFRGVRASEFSLGRVADRDFVVERDVIYTDEQATQLKRQAAATLVPPIFRVNEDLADASLKKLDSFRESVAQLTAAGGAADAVFLRLQLAFPGTLSREQVSALVSQPRIPELLGSVRSLLSQAYQAGLLSLPEKDQELFTAGAYELWRWRDGKLAKEILAEEDALTHGQLSAWVAERLPDWPERRIRVAQALVEAFAVDNALFDKEQTVKHRQRAAAEVEPVVGKLTANQVILRKGDIVTADKAAQVKAVGDYSASVNLASLVAVVLYVAIIFAFTVFMLPRTLGSLRPKLGQVIFMAASVVLYVLLAGILSKVFTPPRGLPFSIILPTAGFTMLVAMLTTTNAGFVLALTMTLLMLPVAGMEVGSFLFASLSGIAGTAVVSRAEKRIDLVRAGLILAVLNCVALAALNLQGGYESGWILPALGWGILGGLACSMIGLGFQPVLEQAMNVATRFRLIELSDLNAPVLKRMLSLAPGTYSHSISVANLAESACDAIGANALLARVGAYYHDIGKIDQAEYFIENQRAFNKHDELKPSLSVAVIKSHLKIGIEKAREINLPREVIDLISQHHGRGVIKYFYQRALDQNGSQKNQVTSEDYSYAGVRPRTREAAVVMLADTVEAASRTLKKPTVAKLEKFVWDIIMEKFNAGELAECDLTLRDLDVIKRSFVQVLAGYFHSRIEYPKVKEEIR